MFFTNSVGRKRGKREFSSGGKTCSFVLLPTFIGSTLFTLLIVISLRYIVDWKFGKIWKIREFFIAHKSWPRLHAFMHKVIFISASLVYTMITLFQFQFFLCLGPCDFLKCWDLMPTFCHQCQYGVDEPLGSSYCKSVIWNYLNIYYGLLCLCIFREGSKLLWLEIEQSILVGRSIHL